MHRQLDRALIRWRPLRMRLPGALRLVLLLRVARPLRNHRQLRRPDPHQAGAVATVDPRFAHRRPYSRRVFYHCRPASARREQLPVRGRLLCV